MPPVETRWAASCVPVYLDTPEMDSPVQVIRISTLDLVDALKLAASLVGRYSLSYQIYIRRLCDI